jgi:hypothetical protein
MIYFSNFNNGFGKQETFGQFGDFVGGVLNPFLTFLTIFLLVWSITIQVRELRSTNEQLKASREELANSAAALEQTKTTHELNHNLQLKQARRKELQDAFEYQYSIANDLFSQEIPIPKLLGGPITLYQLHERINDIKIFGLQTENSSSLALPPKIRKSITEFSEQDKNRHFYIQCKESVLELCSILNEFHKHIETTIVSISYYRRTLKLLNSCRDSCLIDGEDYQSLLNLIDYSTHKNG